ncbi:MAG: hypothetical protein MUE34_16010 [Acidimicrobiales bacterium]|jgi:hypothetical protein|nr:hypothetical protein [Acidimicrobiales bacterium]
MSNEAEFDPGAVADAELFEDDDTLLDDERPAFEEEDLEELEAIDAGDEDRRPG